MERELAEGHRVVLGNDPCVLDGDVQRQVDPAAVIPITSFLVIALASRGHLTRVGSTAHSTGSWSSRTSQVAYDAEGALYILLGWSCLDILREARI